MAKINVKEAQFGEIFDQSKLNPAFKEEMGKMYQEHKAEIKQLLEEEAGTGELHFKELHWRLDIEIAGKTKTATTVPKFLLNLIMEKDGKESAMVLESSYANMRRLKEELQNAVNSLSLSYGRKVLKYAK